ncbi:leukemia inhibitory factor receptor-like [Clarias magur]|uniref:Leukemia inhibitory factor receptor-like n=1 Tax=Clarias magur TaxID=1594786 RepID=A0A8J4X0Q1_CLAMG|nr:leukemia inhibitory factor receptor-like [Clarias magur]
MPLECTSHSIRLRARHEDAVSQWSPLLTIRGMDARNLSRAVMYPQDAVLQVGGNVTVCCISSGVIPIKNIHRSCMVNRIDRRLCRSERWESSWTLVARNPLGMVQLSDSAPMDQRIRLLEPRGVMSEVKAWEARVRWNWTVDAYSTLDLLCEVQLESGGHAHTSLSRRDSHGVLTAYEVSQRDGDGWTTVSLPPSVSSAPITLSNSSDVTVSVAARNSAGLSERSMLMGPLDLKPPPHSLVHIVESPDKEVLVTMPGGQDDGRRDDEGGNQNVELDTDSDDPALLRYYNQLVSDASDSSTSSMDSAQTQVTYTGIQSPAYRPQTQAEARFEEEAPREESPGGGYKPQCSWRPDSPGNENFCGSLGSPTSVTSSQFLIPETSEEHPESSGSWFQNLLSGKF